jgi:hypothetical protein
MTEEDYWSNMDIEIADSIAAEIDKHILSSIILLGDMTSVKDSNLDNIIEMCVNSSLCDNNVKGLQNLIYLMGRQIKIKHCG